MRLSRLGKPLLLLAGLVAAGVLLRELRDAGMLDTGFLDRVAGRAGIPGEVVFVALGAVACMVGIPRQAVAFAGGTAFGALMGTLLGLVAMVAGCAGSFLWARAVGRDWARRRIERAYAGRLARLDRFLADNTFTAALTLRLLPVGNNLAITLLAGLSGVAFLPFLLGSALGYVPQTVVFALLGKGVRVDGAVQLWLGFGLFAASILLGVWLLRRGRRAREAAEASGLEEEG
ncbi:TVP38/TMEM64 family protein [Elioraea rosea]|uniref:TVP38/TMEM64 family protein n=1 Tax=Elioraea rosea TaxID=2492390 RepID=UPI001EF5A1DB|nr:VTT domain-containing protein [Elioraea rosea]